MPEYFIDRFVNRNDGNRAWHSKVSAKGDLLLPGVCLWVGDYKTKCDLVKESYYLFDYEERQGDSLRAVNTPQAFFGTKGEMDENGNHFWIDSVSNKIAHGYEGCGDKWIGIARYPLPQNSVLATARWPGWAHVMHWSDQWEGYQYVPDPLEAIDSLASRINTYPNNLQDLASRMVDILGSPKMLRPELLKNFFPYFDPRMPESSSS